ncbi:DNA-binding response regulator [Paraburkholderia dinghuensis]|uniref:DNA-binding response regulator n=1 Tax=Paraburkholderia dinghuensis TaxID=2305225 RepID=A0A3N6MU99_9BURK|nr:response regulator transcription factor [Paraburkholderia dinghuensis]RQG99871.1 DNA-binding response regulator [Paraburkholderia dinghuensis]
MKLRVVLADDHPFVLLGVRAALSESDGIEVVGEASSPAALFRILATVPCEVVVTDLTMPGGPDDAEDGLFLVRRLRRDCPSLHIVVLTSITNVAILRAVMHAGVSAILKKSESMDELIRAVRGAGCGPAYVGSSIQRDLAIAGLAGASSTRVPRLSPRESEVVRHFAGGHSVSEIARILGRDVRTVSRQKRDAMTKLGVSNDPGLIALVRVYGLS